jgi:hypothetical protein
MSLALYASTPSNFKYLVWMSVAVESVIFALYSYFAYNYTFHRGGTFLKNLFNQWQNVRLGMGWMGIMC